MKRILSLLLTLCLALSAAACAKPAPEAVALTAEESAMLADLNERFTAAFLAEDYETCTADFDATMTAALPADKVKEAWESTVKGLGVMENAAPAEYRATADYLYAATVFNFAVRGVQMRLTVTREGEIAGLFFTYADKTGEAAALPDGIVEEDIIVGEGTLYPLSGKLTLPASPDGKLTAVVLVHGSGPQDMDETIFSNKPFRDIAHALAQAGYAVVRYDKRTYSHGEACIAQGGAFTVAEESVEDAVLAKALLAADARIDADKIFVAGHSLGGMLTPRIAETGGFAGGIILAGSPRRLVDIIYMQNEDVLATMYGQEKLDGQALVDAEMQKYEALFLANDDAALQNTQTFGAAAFYYAEMDRHPAADYLASGKPYLVLQGTLDYQVSYEHDFKLYEAMNLPNLDCRAYENLNHLFMPSTMLGLNDYAMPQQVDARVLTDIAAWLRAR